MEEAPKPFVIPVERRWKLWILPVLTLIYFVAVVTLVALNVEIEGVPMEYLVYAGLGLFLLTFVVQLPFFFRRRRRKVEGAEGTSVEEPSGMAYDDADAFMPPPMAPVMAPPPVMRAPADDEYHATSETRNGMKVLEYSQPAKSRRRGAVYAKAFVPVTKEHMLRVETLAAERHEL